jgi:hypothetical protein
MDLYRYAPSIEMRNYMYHRLTADKREIKDFLKLPSATSFICKPLSVHFGHQKRRFIDDIFTIYTSRKYANTSFTV